MSDFSNHRVEIINIVRITKKIIEYFNDSLRVCFCKLIPRWYSVIFFEIFDCSNLLIWNNSSHPKCLQSCSSPCTWPSTSSFSLLSTILGEFLPSVQIFHEVIHVVEAISWCSEEFFFFISIKKQNSTYFTFFKETLEPHHFHRITSIK